MVELNIERNKVSNLLAFAPDYANVLELNVDLVKRYPGAYSDFVNTSIIKYDVRWRKIGDNFDFICIFSCHSCVYLNLFTTESRKVDPSAQ